MDIFPLFYFFLFFLFCSFRRISSGANKEEGGRILGKGILYGASSVPLSPGNLIDRDTSGKREMNPMGSPESREERD